MFFFVAIFLIATVGIYIVREQCYDKCLLISFGLISFLFGFIPPLVEGGSLLSLSRIEPEAIQAYCDMDLEDPSTSISKMMRGIIEYANIFDEFTEGALD